MSAIVSEFSRYTKKKVMTDEERAFLSMFDPQCIKLSPDAAASWLPSPPEITTTPPADSAGKDTNEKEAPSSQIQDHPSGN